MKNIKKLICVGFALLLNLSISQYCFAHMMVAQHGSLNVVDDGVFMVLSLPVSAFDGIDDDKDGKLSKVEFTEHRTTIAKVISDQVVLQDKSGKLALQGMMLSLVNSHHSPKEPASQLIVMGRYPLVDPKSILQYQVALFGTGTSEQIFEITATRKSDNQKQTLELSPDKMKSFVF